MDPIPTASVLQSLDDHLTKGLIKASQPPIADEEMSDITSPQHTSHSPSKSSSGRASFSSVREVDDNIAQAFSSSKISSYFREEVDTAVVEDNNSGPSSVDIEMAETQFMPPVTQPQSRLHGCWFPAVAADNFQGWKQIGVKGKQASKSFGDLQALRMVWSPALTAKKPRDRPVVQRAPGDSRLERLPTEIKSELQYHPFHISVEHCIASSL